MTNGSVMLRTSGIDRPPTIQILVHLLPKAECLNGEIFYTLREAQIIIESWRRHYNRASEHPSVYVIEEKRFC